MTYEDLVRANSTLKTIDVKGKNYVQVNDRVKAFRQICPGGSITTEVLSLEDGVVTMKTTVADENGNVLATGLAQEKESSSYINKTSFIENCETSACGRALGFLGIGIDGSMCSAEELVNAITNQNKIGKKEVAILRNLLERKGLTEDEVFPAGIESLTDAQYAEACKKLGKIKDKA